MLYKNHKKVDLKSEPVYKLHKDEFEAFIKGKKQVLFKTHDKIKFNKTGAMEPPRIQAIPAEVVYTDTLGNDDSWIYLEKAPKVLQNGENDYERVKRPILVSRTLSVPTTKQDLIFFLMYLSSAAKTGRLYAFNEEKEDEKKLVELSRASNVDFFLTSEYSPLTKDNMRRIAKAFGIESVDKMSDAKLILTLKAIVDKAEREKDEYRNVAAFMKAMEEEEVTATKAIVQEAMDAKRIVYWELDGTWYYTDEEGQKIKKIATVDLLNRNNRIKRESTLHNVFLSDERKRKELKTIMGYSSHEVDFNNYEYGSLKTFAVSCGLSGAGKKDELIDRITKHYNEEKNNKKFDMSLLIVSQKETVDEE